MDGSRAATGAGWFAGALSGALVLLFALTATGPALATSDDSATLGLDRSEGPPGTKVTATLRGYAECQAANTTGAESGGGEVKIFWEGVEKAVGSAVVSASGTVEVPFTVPAEATAQRYSIVARCMTNAQLTDDDVFMVTRSEKSAVVPPATVPTPSVTPPSVTPSAVVPPPVTPSSVTTPSVTPSKTSAPQLVRVPRVVGLKVADATAKVAALGLVLRVTSEDGDVVASQSPATGSMVGVGHAVRVATKPAVAPVPPAPVPTPVGEQPVDARSYALPFPWWTAALLALVVLAFGAVTYLVTRRWLDQRWVRTKLRVVVPPAPAADPRLTETVTAPPMPVVSIEPHAAALSRGTD